MVSLKSLVAGMLRLAIVEVIAKLRGHSENGSQESEVRRFVEIGRD